MANKDIIEYISERERHLRSSPFDKYRFQFINMLLKNLPNQHILDIGCHIGSIAKFYGGSGRKVTFIDIDPFLIKCAKFSNRQLPIKQLFICGTVENLPLKNSIFDTIIASEVIEHIPKDRHNRVLGEILRVGRKNSTIFLTTPNRFSLAALEGKFIEFFVGNYHWNAWDLSHKYIYTSWEFRKFVTFKNIFIKSIYGFYYLPGSLIVRLPIVIQNLLGIVSFLISKYFGRLFPFKYVGFTTIIIMQKL